MVEGIRISHPERVIDASTGVTKLDVVDYYVAVSKLILPQLVKRPVSMVRAPAGLAGKLFFQRHAEALKIAGLEQLDPKIAPETSGGKGLHVVVPIAPKLDWDAVKALSKALIAHMAEVIPERFVARSGPKNRVGRIFVDHLRNGFGATTACAWSAPARPGMGVSVPCAWDELGSLTGGAHWTIRNVHERIEKGGDPWQAYAKTRQTLVKASKALLD